MALQDSLENPERGDFHLALGKQLRQELKLSKAREELLQAQNLSQNPNVRLDATHYLQTQMPRFVKELSPLARYYTLAGEFQQYEAEDLWQAANYYQKALQEQPGFEWAYNELAIIYRELKDHKKAGIYAQIAMTLNPDFYNAYLTMGDISLDSEAFEQAITHFKGAQTLIGRWPEQESGGLVANIENQLGFAYESLHNSPEALTHYRLAMKAASLRDDDVAVSDYEYAQESITRVTESQQRAAQFKKESQQLSALPKK
jgi:tetratricopeptide (TPR) repeat protein